MKIMDITYKRRHALYLIGRDNFDEDKEKLESISMVLRRQPDEMQFH